MKLTLEIVDRCSDSELPVIDLIAHDSDTAFQLGEMFTKLFDNRLMNVLRIDGHGMRIILSKRKSACLHPITFDLEFGYRQCPNCSEIIKPETKGSASETNVQQTVIRE